MFRQTWSKTPELKHSEKRYKMMLNCMEYQEQELFPIRQFAFACEQMNEFAQSLRASSKFGMVRTGADIRNYKNGWRLEKWVEAELNKEQGLWAAWWLESGPREKGWIVESHLAVSPEVFYFGLEDHFASSPQELSQQLSKTVQHLKDALDQNHEFAEVVKKIIQ
jgi:hypothetical protein